MWVWWVVGALVVGATADAGGVRSRTIDSRLQTVRASTVLHVYVRFEPEAPPDWDRVGRAGFVVERVRVALGLAQGWVEAAKVAGVAAVEGVRRIEPVDRARPRAGAVTSEGDAAAGADRARAQGFDGTGIVVGVISDGIDALAAARASGDLPVVTVPEDARCGVGSGDEGTALLEIVHDLAPGAGLLFSGAATSLEFIDAVHCLVAAGARVIVDDLGFFGEPFFADGPVAAAVREAVAAGVSWVSAAGNEALQHFEEPYRAGLCGSGHDLGGDCTNALLVGPFETVECVLQWNDPPRAATNDYDLFLLDESGAVLSAGADEQSGQEDPVEGIVWSNPASGFRLLGLRIERTRGESRLLEMFCLGGIMEHVTPAGSVIGHPALAEVVAVGAIDVADPGHDDVEAYSAQGPAQLFFPVAMRAKPDLVAFDGVSTTRPDFAPFFGTSAAAPHVAAVAALLLSKNPFLTPARIHEVLQNAASDIGVAGRDSVAGAGRLAAVPALDMVPRPECRAQSDCAATSACPIDACTAGTCAHSVVRGGDPACAGQVMPRALPKRFDRACRRAAGAAAADAPARAARLARLAERALARAAELATRAGRRRISPACGAAVEAGVANARALLAGTALDRTRAP